MDFKQFEENVAAYVEGLLDEKMMRAMEAKRAECPECDNLACLHENILAALNSTEPVKAPAGLEQRILAVVEAERAEAAALQKTKRRALVVSLSAAAAVLAGLVPFLIGALGKGAASIPDTSEGFSIVIIFAARWWAGVETMFFIVTDSNRWPSLQLLMQYLTQRIEIPNVPVTIPGYYLFALVSALAVMAWVTRDYFGRQQKPAVSSLCQRSLI